MFKSSMKRIQQTMLWLGVWVISLPAWADLPKPPDSDMATGNSDWIDVGGNLAYKSLRYSCMIIGAMILAGRRLWYCQSLSHRSGKTGFRTFFQTRRSSGGRCCHWGRFTVCRLYHYSNGLMKEKEETS